MESAIKPGQMIEIGSNEWSAWMISKIVQANRDIQALRDRTVILEGYRDQLEKTFGEYQREKK